MTGIRKSNFIHSLIAECRRQEIDFDEKEINELSIGQLRKQLKELKGDKYVICNKQWLV